MSVISQGEAEFNLHCQAFKLEPVREYRFHPKRKWRFDFAFPEKMVAVEIEGGVYQHGRHTRGSGYVADLQKYNAATLLGWRVLRYSTGDVAAGQAIDEVRQILNGGACNAVSS